MVRGFESEGRSSEAGHPTRTRSAAHRAVLGLDPAALEGEENGGPQFGLCTGPARRGVGGPPLANHSSTFSVRYGPGLRRVEGM